MPIAELELAQAEETVTTRPRAPLMRLMIEVQCETRVARDAPGADPLPLLAQDVLRQLFGAHEAAVGAAQAHPDTFRIEAPEVHPRLADRLAVRLDGQEGGAIHPRPRVRIDLDRDVVAEAAGQLADEAAGVEVGHLRDGVAALEQGLPHLDAVASQWREGPHSDDHGLVAPAGGGAHGLHSVSGRTFTSPRHRGPVSFSPSRPSIPAGACSGAGRGDPEASRGGVSFQVVVQRRNPPSTRWTVPLQ